MLPLPSVENMPFLLFYSVLCCFYEVFDYLHRETNETHTEKH